MIVQQTTAVPVGQIIVRDRRRPINPATVTALAESMSRGGLIQPIVVSEQMVLIAGNHRLEAARLLGWPDILATIMSADEIEAEILEIDENLVREDLDPVQRATLIARRKELYEADYPETKHGASGESRPRGDSLQNPRFTEDLAQRTGRGERAIQRDARIGSHFEEHQLRHLRTAKVSLHLIERLCSLPYETRASVCALPPEQVKSGAVQALQGSGYKVDNQGHCQGIGKGTPNKKNRKPARAKTLRERDLEGWEVLIEGKLEAFMDVAHALWKIREKRLFIDTHGEFCHYLKARWAVPFARGRSIVGAIDAIHIASEGEDLNDSSSESEIKQYQPGQQPGRNGH